MDLQNFLHEELGLIAQNHGKDIYSFYDYNIRKQYTPFKRVVKRLITICIDIYQRCFRKPAASGKINVFFLFLKFYDVMEAECEYFNIFVGAETMDFVRNFRKFRRLNFMNMYDTDMYLNFGYLHKDTALSQKAVETLMKLFRQNDIKVIILGHDKLFIERACIQAARTLNIPVVTFQHGIYSTDVEQIRNIKGDKETDFFWCWSDSVKDAYLKAYGWDSSKVSVMGYPYISKLKKGALITQESVLYS